MAFSIIGSIFSAVMMSMGITTALISSRYEVNLHVLFRSTVFYVNDFLFWETPEKCYCPIIATHTTHSILSSQNISAEIFCFNVMRNYKNYKRKSHDL